MTRHSLPPTASLFTALLVCSCASTVPSPRPEVRYSDLSSTAWSRGGAGTTTLARPRSTARFPESRLQDEGSEVGTPSRVSTPSRVRTTTLLLGSRTLDDSFFWEPLEDQNMFGLEFDSYIPGGFGYEMGFHVARASESLSGVSFETTTIEFNFGARKTWEVGDFHPYLGGGLSLVATSLEIGSGFIDEADGGLGFYLHGGGYFRIANNLTLGFDYRILRGTEIELDGFVPTDVDYTQLALTVGFSF